MSSVRLLKDRGGAGGKITAINPSKALTPDKLLPSDALKRSLSAKENPRPKSAVRAATQKPTMRVVPRVDKSAVGSGTDGVESQRVRWSVSSVPRGRSPSPTQFSRVLSDSKGKENRVSRASSAKRDSRDSVVKERGRAVAGLKSIRDGKESGKNGVILEKKSGSCQSSAMKFEKSSGCKVNYEKKEGITGLDFNTKTGVRPKVDPSCNRKSCSDTSIVPSNEPLEKSLGKEKNLGIMKEKAEDSLSNRAGIRYPSRLHEKLAFLEGKVKRIANDIKKTKEMLDANNPDASKVILSDIQDKISGIEKAMGNVVGKPDGQIGLSEGAGNDNPEIVAEKSHGKTDEKNSVKGLKSEELEARLLPHHKLLKNRTSLKPSIGASTGSKAQVLKPNCNKNIEEKSLSPIEENPIALEFLASLNREQTKVTTASGISAEVPCDVQEGGRAATSEGHSTLDNGKQIAEIVLTSDEKLDDFDVRGSRQNLVSEEENEESCILQLNRIGCKTTTGGWFVSEGEAALLAHDDGSCTYYDIVNCEEKVEYKPPAGVSPNMWRDCWIIRAPGADGCSGKYVVAASAGNSLNSGYCVWDYYNKNVQAFHVDGGSRTSTSRTVLGPLPNNVCNRRHSSCSILAPEVQQWWYKPCGPLIMSGTSGQKFVRIDDIRDGELVMNWELTKPVSAINFSSPLQWRNRGKAVVAEAETISLWDVNSLRPQALLSIPMLGRKISALHVNNTDAEKGGGIRQRISSAEAEGNDGVFCTTDSINVLDFRQTSGVGLKIPNPDVSVQSVFSRGDNVFLGGTKQSHLQVQQFSLRKQRLVGTYTLPEYDVPLHNAAITQVWGNSDFVMSVCGMGLFVFDALRDDGLCSVTTDYSRTQKVREIIGPDDLYSPSFDYSSSRALIISRDRPALWRHLH